MYETLNDYYYHQMDNPFSPEQESNLGVWWDGDDTSILYQDNSVTPSSADEDEIGTVEDKSGNDYHIRQSTSANKAQLKLAVINGRNVIRFGGNSFLTYDIANGLIANGDYTLFEVSASTATTSIFSYAEASTISGTPFAGIRHNRIEEGQVGLERRDDSGRLEQVFHAGGFNDGNPHIIEQFRSGDAFSLVVDGTLHVDAVEDPQGQTSVTRIGLGAVLTSVPAAFFNGDVGEVIIYTEAKGSASRATARQYLASKWGITLP